MGAGADVVSVPGRSRSPEYDSPRPAVPARPAGAWSVDTSVTAWCETCGTDVEFAAPAGVCPADLAADERGCVWCGEALAVSVDIRTTAGSATGAPG